MKPIYNVLAKWKQKKGKMHGLLRPDQCAANYLGK